MRDPLPALSRKPAFWVVVLLVSALAAFAVFRYFGDAFSVLDLDVRMSRDDAIAAARRIALDQHLVAAPPADAAAVFGGDAAVQTFVELAGGGKPALKPLVDGDEYALYRWRVRLFTPGVEREAQVAFAPDGRPVGFLSRVPEGDPGPALAADDARAIAVAAAAKDWGVDFARYRALSASAVTRPGGRVDHEFVYERLPAAALLLGDGRLRLRLVVAGDRLALLQRFVQVPQAFARRYETLRSANDTIAAFAGVAAGLVYGLGGCVVGLIWLMRRRVVRWGPAARWAGVVAALITAAALSSIRASWFGYDTATSASTHLFTRIALALVGGVTSWLALTVVFATAEGLGRMAFGGHPQLWRSWRLPAASSRQIWGRTLAGYAWIGFDLAFIAGFYFVVQRWLGWWSPSDALVDPNILGTSQPWTSPVAMALQAGMMEESLFRAVPLAGAALIGRRFGRERTFVLVALVLQAIVFGCAHANYPGQPAYARPVELFVPALVWGWVYLRFGLVPGMLFHFGFDLVLMSIPLFVTSVPGIGFDRAMVIVAFATPLLVLLVQRVRAGRLVELPDDERNAAARRPADAVLGEASGGGAVDAAVDAALVTAVDRVADAVLPDATSTSAHTAVATTVAPVPARASTRASTRTPTRGSRAAAGALVALAFVGAVGIVVGIVRRDDAPPLAIDREQAIVLAGRALAERGVTLDGRWHRTAHAIASGDPDAARFVWREAGPAVYARLIGHQLPPPAWEVRFARFDGDVADRDAWRVVVVDDRGPPDGIRVVEHAIPEARPGAKLGEAAARAVAVQALERWYGPAARAWRPVAATSSERPARSDWDFVYADPSVALPHGAESRVAIEVDGDEVAAIGRWLFVPDAFTRDERRRNELRIVPRAVVGLAFFAFTIAFLVSLVRRVVAGDTSRRAAWIGGLSLAAIVVLAALLDVRVAQHGFTIAEPFDAQMLRVYLRWLASAVGAGLGGALVTAVGVRLASRAERMRDGSRLERMPVALHDEHVPVVAGGDATSHGPSGDAWWTRRWPVAIALALFVVGLGGMVRLFGPSSGPTLPSLDDADSLVPWLSMLLGSLDFATRVAAAVVAAALFDTRRWWSGWAVVLLFVVAPACGSLAVSDTGVPAALAAAAGGALAYGLYRWLIRGRLERVGPIVLATTIVASLAGATRDATLHRAPWPLLVLAGALVGYALWRWLVARDADAPPHASATTATGTATGPVVSP